MSEWQPIETAPREHRRHFLVVLDGEVCEARWSGSGGWHVATFNGQVWKERNPTHWMPLPEPPVSK